MRNLCRLIWHALVGRFWSRASLEAENLALRHQLNILRRSSPKKLALSNIDRLVFTGLYRFDSGIPGALTIIKPETLIRWHRAGFRRYWRWKSRAQGGRPKVEREVRQLIREMSVARSVLGNASDPRRLLKLGINVGQTTVAKYMARGRQPPSQGWKTFPATTLMVSRRWTCSWFRRSRSSYCTGC